MPFQLEVQTSEQSLNQEHVSQLLAALVLRHRAENTTPTCQRLRSECTPSSEEGIKAVPCTATQIEI